MEKPKAKGQVLASLPYHPGRFYRGLVERVDEGVVAVNRTGTILFSNRRFADMVKVRAEKMAGAVISTFIPSFDKKRFEALLQNGGKDEISLKPQGGAMMPARFCTSDMETERGVICITVTCLAEEKRRQQIPRAARLASIIFDQSAEVIIICDEKAKITRTSRSAHRYFLTRLLMKPFDEVCSLTLSLPLLTDQFSISSVLEEGKIYRGLEVTHKRKDGEVFTFVLNARPVMHSNKITGSFITLMDITGRKRMEGELRRSRDELETRVQQRTAELKRTNQQLQESEDRLRLLSSQLLSIQEAERKRIAMEIHDSLGQSLATIKFRTENILHEIRGNAYANAVKPLEGLMPIIQTSIDEARRLQMELRPSILDDLGIQATLSWFCREFQITHPAVRVEQETEIQEHELAKDIKIVIYRIIQEAMNNVAKHSRADRVHLSLKKTGGTVDLVIQDNGRGFHEQDTLSQKGTKRGMGLSSMRERAELSGGTFQIESMMGKGTTIRVTWPL